MPTKRTASATTPLPAAAARGAAVNEAEAYGVRLAPATVPADTLYWQAINVRHLSADENRGKHNVYVRALDENGQRDRNPALRAAYTWEGRQPEENAPPRALDKGDADIGHADIDVYKGQHIEVWLEGDGLPSDHVLNLHTEHEGAEKTSDGEDGNYRYHHSFLVTFQRTRHAAPPTDGGGETAPVPGKPDSGQPASAGGETTPTPSEPAGGAPVATGVNNAAYVRDADHVEDNSVLKPGERFTKQWVLRNTGTTTWGAGYQLVHIAGERLDAPAAVPAPTTPPGADATIAVDFVTHEASTELRSDWRLANPAG